MPRKAKTLLDILARYEGPLTADFQRVYTLRLESAVSERSYQELLDLVYWLPADSAFGSLAAANDDSDKARHRFLWGHTEELLLHLVNQTVDQSWILAQSNSKKRIPRPEPAYGPRGKPQRKNPRDDATAMARMFLAAQGG